MIKYASLILIVVVFFSGCATNNIRSARLDSNKPLPPENGVVSVQVINNTGRLAPLHAGWTEVMVIRLDNRDVLKQAAIEKARTKSEAKKQAFDPEKVEWDLDVYSMSSIAQGTVGSQLFTGTMPEGKYVISTLYSFYSDGNVSSWITMPVMFSAGTFEVKGGRFTNLGSIAFQPLLSVKSASFWSNSSTQKAYIARMNNPENLQQFVTDHYPTASTSIDFSMPLGWQKDELDELRVQLSELSRANAYGADGIALSNDGLGALAAKFGQIRVLDSQKIWRQIDLPTNAQISAILETDNQVFIGGERGQLFVSDSFVGKWQPLQPVAASEAIVWLAKSKHITYALTSSHKAYQLYQADSNLENWQQIGDFIKKNPNDFFVQNGGLFPVLKQNGQVRIINDNINYDYDITTQKWNNKKGQPLVDMTQLRSGVLLGLEVSQWDGVGDQLVSFDEGDSWLSIKRNLRFFGDDKTERTLPAVLSDGTLVSLGRPSTVKQDLKVITQSKANIGDKDTWVTHHNANVDCQTPIPELTNGSTVYFLCDKGAVVSTSDFGDTWQTEVDINIQSMQAKYESFLEALKTQADEKKQAEQSKLAPKEVNENG